MHNARLEIYILSGKILLFAGESRQEINISSKVQHKVDTIHRIYSNLQICRIMSVNIY
jgi:hypothetical protein